MPITVRCDCGKQFQVNDALGGRRGRCKHCGTILTIPTDPDPPFAPEALSIDLSDEDAYAVASAGPAPVTVATGNGVASDHDNPLDVGLYTSRHHEPEPWYYKFLATEAEGWRQLALLLVAVSAAGWLLMTGLAIYGAVTSDNPNWPYTIAILCVESMGQAVVTFLVWRSMTLFSAWIHLSVDHARNARRVRLVIEAQAT